MDNFKYLLQEEKLYTLAEQLCQHNREKRDITDVAISKIPYVVFPDLDINSCLILHELGEYLLKQAKNLNHSNEVAITYNLANNLDIVKDGFTTILSKAGVCLGTEKETDLFSDTQTMSVINRAKSIAVVNLHNHPSCSSFSNVDIATFLKETAIKLMIVIGNNGELYYLSKDIDYNHNLARRYLTQAADVIKPGCDENTYFSEQDLRDVSDLFLKNCTNFGITYAHVLGTNRKLEHIHSMQNFSAEEKQDEDIER